MKFAKEYEKKAIIIENKIENKIREIESYVLNKNKSLQLIRLENSKISTKLKNIIGTVSIFSFFFLFSLDWWNEKMFKKRRLILLIILWNKKCNKKKK